MTESRPFTAASFNQYLAEHKLMASHCPACDAVYLPPRAVCPTCHSEELAWVELSGKGNVAAFTAINIAPTMMIEEGYGRDKPYCTGIVEVDEGAKISARLLGFDPAAPSIEMIGTPVTVDFVETGEGDGARTYLAFKAE